MRHLACFVVFGLLVLSGCGQPVNIEKTVTLDPAAAVGPIVLDGPKGDQKITVEFTSSEAPVDVHVILGSDENAIRDELQRAKPKVEPLASQTKSKAGTLTATIPAGKDYGVYLNNAMKKTTVTLKLTGR
jgi:hypothetical protein